MTSRHPLWDGPLDHVAPAADADPVEASLGIDGALGRQMTVTAGLSARPEGVAEIPKDSYVPVVVAAALALFFIGLLVYAALVVAVGVVILLVAVARWTWRTEGELR